MKQLIYRSFIIFAALFFGVIFFLAPSAHATHEQNASHPWRGEVSSGFIRDSNILLVKDNKESDVIWESSLYLSYKPKAISWHVLAIFDRYLSNSELNYAYYELGAQRALGQHNYGGLSLNLSPDSLLDKQDPNRNLLSLASHGFNLFVERDTEQFGTIGLNIRYTRFNYNTAFDAKDSDLLTIGPSIFYRITDNWDFFGEYSHASGKAKTGLIPLNFGPPVFDDISYKASSLYLVFTHWMPERTRLRFRYIIRKKDFTAGDADSFHQGRKDTTHLLSAEIKRYVFKNVSIRTQLKQLWKRSNQDFVNYSANKIALWVTYQF